jgi:hypothetical protein
MFFPVEGTYMFFVVANFRSHHSGWCRAAKAAAFQPYKVQHPLRKRMLDFLNNADEL